MKKKIIFVALISFIVFCFFSTVYAEDSVNITLKVYSGDTVLFDGPETVTACAESLEVDAPITVNGKCAIEQSGLSNTWTWNYTPSGWLDELGEYTTTPDYSKYWGYFINLDYGTVALNQYILSSGEELLLTYNSYPLRISASQIFGMVGDTIIFTAEEKSTFNETFDMVWTPSSDVIVTLGTQSCTTIADGTCSIVLNTAGSLNAIGSKSLYVPSAGIDIEVSTAPPPPPTPHHHSSGSSGSIIIPDQIKPVFDIKKAFDFLSSQQKIDGSFGEDIYTDWTTIAFASSPEYQDQKEKLKKYFLENKLSGTLLTDYERRSMALMSLGRNPYNTNGENYIEKIISFFDGTQFGDATQDNDDIFALIVLQNAGYMPDEKIITDTINFILSKQKINGSWDENVDMTGAGIEALDRALDSIQIESKALSIKTALEKAKEYLKQNQKDDGGFGNVSSTAWAMQGILALGEKIEDWKKNDPAKDGASNTPIDYTALNQDTDGGMKNENIKNKIWETSYVASALSGKTWNEIMQKFEKPKIEPKTEIAQVPQKEIIKSETKKIVKVVKNNKKKLENLASQIVASPISAVIDNPVEEKIPEPVKKESWFRRFIRKIFGF